MSELEQDITTITTELLRRHLDRGGNFRFVQRFNKDGKSHTEWTPVDEPYVQPFKLNGRFQVYWGVNPTACTVTEADRQKDWAKGKTDKEIEEFIASKNDTVAAVNALYAEFDGKDFTVPTQAEIDAQTAIIKLNTPNIDSKALKKQTLSRAREIEFLNDIPSYKDRALEHIRSRSIQPSVIIDSGGGFQCYWLLGETYIIDDQEKRDFIKWLQAAWVAFVGADDSAKDLRRILRVPDFLNIKKAYGPDFPIVSYIDADLDLQYSTADFEKLVPPRVVKPAHQAKADNAFNAQRNGAGYHGESVIDAFNAKHKIADVLQDCGYTWVGDRMAKPGGENGTVAIYEDDNQSYHHGGEDPLHNGHRVDPFEAFAYYKHNGNLKQAVKAAAQLLGIGKDKDGFGSEHTNLDTEATEDQTPNNEQAAIKVNVVAYMLKMIIDTNYLMKIDTLKPVIRDLGREERFDPRIVEQLERVIKEYRGQTQKERIKYWLESCGHEGDTNAEQWLAALKSLPYHFALNRLEDDVEVNGARLDDVTRSKIYLAMEQTKAPKGYVDDTINVLASEQSYHPVQRYLLGLEWDGKDHVLRLLQHIKGDDKEITYSDGTKAPLHWQLIRRWLLGCVARALDGDKASAFRHQTPVLVFIGKQGKGKSSFVRWLCSGIGHQFHREGSLDPHKIEDQRSMVCQWIWEISELGSSLRKGDRDSLKGFITQQSFTYRRPWGRSNITKPVLCNLVGSINQEAGFLDDATGHRRFLPVVVEKINWNYKSIDVDQLWAQLVHEYQSGVSPELSKPERIALDVVHKEHEVENPLQGHLQTFFDVVPGDTARKTFTSDIILRLQDFGVRISGHAKVAGRELNDALAPLGLERKFFSVDGIKGWGWVGIAPNSKVAPKKTDSSS